MRTNPAEVTLAEVRDKVAEAAKRPHPRLFAGCEGEALRRKIAADPAMADYFTCIRVLADQTLATPLLERKMTGRRLLSVSRACLDRMFALGFAWRVTGERKYARRAAAEALAVCRFTDWNPSHFLDTAEMSLAVALCLDWLYDTLAPGERDELALSLIEKGLKASEASNGWVSASNNWGQVCHGGMTAAALAVMEKDPELAARIIHQAVTHVPLSMAVYAPDGGYPEGPGYWHYGTIYNVLLIECLESGLCTDFGLSRLPGFGETGVYIQVAMGPGFDNFNYADGWAGKSASTLVYWFANRFGIPVNPALTPALEAEWHARAIGKPDPKAVRQGRFEAEFLFAGLKKDPKGKGPLPPLDWQDRGEVPIAVHRGSWDSPNALYVGIKAGSPSHNHGQMDSGSFVLDALGVRWAEDLGAEDYERIESRGMNLWNREQESDRWRIFRLGTASHNTLVVDGQQQIAGGKALITAFSDDPASPSTIIDLTPNYADQAAAVTRTFSLPQRQRVEIRDRLAGLKPGSRVRWGMVTRAAIGITGSQATLKQEGKALALTAEGAGEAPWRIYNTATPPAEWDSPNPGTAMIGFEVEAPASGALEFVVSLLPL